MPARITGLEEKVKFKALPPISRRMLDPDFYSGLPENSYPSLIYAYKTVSIDCAIEDNFAYYLDKTLRPGGTGISSGMAYRSFSISPGFHTIQGAYTTFTLPNEVAYLGGVKWGIIQVIGADHRRRDGVIGQGYPLIVVRPDINADSTILFRTYDPCKVYIIPGTRMVSLAEGHEITDWVPNVFVPDSMLNQYKTATNWSTVADHIYPISSYNNFID